MEITFGGMFPAIAGVIVLIVASLAARRLKKDIERHKSERAAREAYPAE